MSIDFRWSVDRGALKKALDKFKKTFDARSNIPVLACVEVTPDLFHGGALLRVTDLDTHHTVRLDGECTGDKLLMDFRQLLKIVDALQLGMVTVNAESFPIPEYDEVEKEVWQGSVKKKVTEQQLKYQPPAKVLGTLGKKTFSLFRWDHTSDGNDLPDAPFLVVGFPTRTFSLDLHALVAPVLHAVATDDSRYGLNGVLLEVYPDGSVGAMSTDGHRMVTHHARVEEKGKGVVGPLLPRSFCANLKDVAAGPIVLTWWRPLDCGVFLNSLSTVDTSRFIEGAPLYRVHFDLGGDGKASRTVVREDKKISVIPEVRPKTATCTVRTSSENLTDLLSSRVSLVDFQLACETIHGDVSHLHALYAEIRRSDMIRVEHPDGTVLVTKCLDGDFPDWRQVVPQRFLREATVDRKTLDAALKYVMTVASEKTHCVRVSLRDGSLLLYASNPDEGELSDEVPAETRGDLGIIPNSYTDEEGKKVVGIHKSFCIGLNGQYLRDEIAVLGTPSVELKFGDVLNPVILRHPGDDSLMCVVMPMRLE